MCAAYLAMSGLTYGFLQGKENSDVFVSMCVSALWIFVLPVFAIIQILRLFFKPFLFLGRKASDLSRRPRAIRRVRIEDPRFDKEIQVEIDECLEDPFKRKLIK